MNVGAWQVFDVDLFIGFVVCNVIYKWEPKS